MKIIIIIIALITISSQTKAQSLPTHSTRSANPGGCSTCHFTFTAGRDSNPKTCFQCHTSQSKMISRLPEALRPFGIQPADIEAEYQKRYHHPSYTPRAHSAKEMLPETNPKAPRHADCVDCHDRHGTTPDKKLIAPPNPNQSARTADQLPEHILCYRCHGDSANLPGKFTNKRLEFSTSNKSFHPIEAEGRNSAVVSLIRPYKAQKSAPGDVSILTCGSCHSSDNKNAPRGPHGSQYEGILTDHYSKDDNTPENSYQYALCYRCHKRESILNNDSFKFHSIHIQGIPGKSRGTSCYTCHNSHGSVDYKYLLKFNPQIVTANKQGLLKFMENGNSKFSGKCFLTCHGVEHNPKSY